MLKIRHYELPKMINRIYERLFIYLILKFSWWRHEMETFSALLAICAGNSPVPGEFPAQRPVTQSFDVLFDLRLNKRLSKQSWGWWFETPSHPSWRHRNVLDTTPGSLRIKFQKPHSATFYHKHNSQRLYHRYMGKGENKNAKNINRGCGTSDVVHVVLGVVTFLLPVKSDNGSVARYQNTAFLRIKFISVAWFFSRGHEMLSGYFCKSDNLASHSHFPSIRPQLWLSSFCPLVLG